MPSSEVYEVCTDQQGYIWFSSDAGIGRFANNKIISFSKKDGIPDNTIFHLTPYKDSQLIISCYNAQLGLIHISRPHYTKLFSAQLPKDIEQPALIKNTYCDKDNTFWLSTNDGLFKKTQGSLDFSRCSKVDSSESVDLYIQGQHIIENIDSKFMLYLFSSKPYFTANIISKNKVVSYKLQKFYSNQNLYSRSLLLKNGDVLFTLSNTIYILRKDGTVSIKHFNNYIYSLYQDHTGAVWIGLRTDGIIYMHDMNHLNEAKQMLKGNSITSFCTDLEGGLWCSSLENGVFYNSSKIFKHIDEAEFREQKIMSIDTGFSSIYVGNANSNIARYSFNENNDLVQVNKLGPLNSEINTIQKIGNRLIVSLIENTFMSDSTLKKLNLSSLEHQKYHGKLILASPKTNDIFMASVLSITNVDQQKQIQTKNLIERIFSLAFNKAGQLFIGCNNGLFIYENDSLHSYMPSNPVLRNRIAFVTCDAKDRIWVCIRGLGIAIIDGNKFLHLSEKDGLCSGNTTCIVNDGDIAWIGTKNGLSKVHLSSMSSRSFSIENYYYEDGLISNEIRQLKIFKDHLVIGTSRGLCYAKLNEIKPLQANVPMNVFVEDQLVNEKTEITFRYNTKKIHFAIETPDYRDFSKPSFIYSLNGSGQNLLENSNALVLENMKYGDYTLQIDYAKYHTNQFIKTIKFSIQKPIWLKWWFLLLVGISSIILLAWMINYRIHKIKISSAQRIQVDKQIAEYKIKSLQAQLNPHFLFNMLNTIFSMSRTQSPKTPEVVLGLSSLLRFMLYETQSELIPLESEIKMIDEFIELQQVRFENKIKVNKRYHGLQPASQIAPLLLFPLIENAFKHGMGRSIDHANIDIDISLENGKLFMQISNSIFTSSVQKSKASGIGLTNIKQQLELLYTDFDIQVIQDAETYSTKLSINLKSYTGINSNRPRYN